MDLDLFIQDQIIPLPSVTMIGKTLKITDTENSEERRILFKKLIKIHFQKNIIQHTLTNIISIYDKSIDHRNMM